VHLLPAVERRLKAGETVRLHVLALAGRVPASGVGGVLLGVTAVDATANGSLTVAACGTKASPAALWYSAGRPTSTAAFVVPDTTGSVCVTVSAPTHLLVDLRGYTAATGGFHAVRATRVFDTRPQHAAARVVPARAVAPGTVLKVRFTALSTLVPGTGVGAVAFHLTATGAASAGAVTVWSCGTKPRIATLSFTAASTSTVALLVAPDASGSICFATSAAVHLAADITGWVATGRGFHPVLTTRVLDARVTTTALSVRPGVPFAVQPTAAAAWSLRVSVVTPDGAGAVTVQACGSTTRVATVSFAARQSSTVAVIVPTNPTSGAWCVTATRPTRVLLEVDGWFAR
jgi:hypothetical protein